MQNWLLPTFDGLAVGDFWVLQPQNADSSFLYRLIQSRQFDEVANQSTGTKMPRAGIYADSLSKTLDCTVCITDTDQVIAAAGNGKKELQEMLLSAELAEVFQERKTVLKKSSDAEFVAITKDRSEYSEEIISVILNEGDIAGGVIFLQKNEKKHFGEMEKKFAAGAADLLGRQLS